MQGPPEDPDPPVFFDNDGKSAIIASSQHNENHHPRRRSLQAIRQIHRRRPHFLRHRRRGVLWLPGPERRRQNLDGAHDPLRFPGQLGDPSVQGMAADVDNRAIKKMTGVIPQEINLDIDLTVRENLMVFAQLFDIAREARAKRIDELLLSSNSSPARQQDRSIVHRDEAAAAYRPGPAQPAADHHRRRTDDRPRSPGPASGLAASSASQKPGRHADSDHTVHGRSPAACDRIVVMHQGKILKAGVPSKLIEDEIGREVTEIRIAPTRTEIFSGPGRWRAATSASATPCISTARTGMP